MRSLKVSQITPARFHHFHLARELEKHNILDTVYTGYPRFALRDETGIPYNRITTFPWVVTPYMAVQRFSLNPLWLDRELSWWSNQALDLFVARSLKRPTILIALSSTGFYSGQKAQKLGGIHICDRGSSHIRIQDNLLREEYKRYGSSLKSIDSRIINKEEAEYDQADYISVPSEFCVDSFVSQGIPRSKIVKIPYGSRLERFYRDIDSANTKDDFRILFVGAAGPRKGFVDLLEAFRRFKHPKKKLVLVGSLTSEAKNILRCSEASNIEILGPVPNAQLRTQYNKATVLVLPSIEEGLAMVIGEALACGTPVIASVNSGASDLIADGVEGFIVPIRSPDVIAERLQMLADNPELLKCMGQASLAKVQGQGGWSTYGHNWLQFLEKIACR